MFSLLDAKESSQAGITEFELGAELRLGLGHGDDGSNKPPFLLLSAAISDLYLLLGDYSIQHYYEAPFPL